MLVVAKNQQGQWQDLLDRQDIECACIKKKAHSSQSTVAGTPSTFQLLLGDFGYLVVGEKAWQRLRGIYVPPPGTNPYEIKFLSCLQMLEEIKNTPPVSTVLLTADYKVGWQEAHEFASSSGPSRYHLGHVKAVSRSGYLSNVEATLMNIPHAIGYFPRR